MSKLQKINQSLQSHLLHLVKDKLSREITTDLVTTTCKKVHLRLEISFPFAMDITPVNALKLKTFSRKNTEEITKEQHQEIQITLNNKLKKLQVLRARP